MALVALWSHLTKEQGPTPPEALRREAPPGPAPAKSDPALLAVRQGTKNRGLVKIRLFPWHREGGQIAASGALTINSIGIDVAEGQGQLLFGHGEGGLPARANDADLATTGAEPLFNLTNTRQQQDEIMAVGTKLHLKIMALVTQQKKLHHLIIPEGIKLTAWRHRGRVIIKGSRHLNLKALPAQTKKEPCFLNTSHNLPIPAPLNSQVNTLPPKAVPVAP